MRICQMRSAFGQMRRLTKCALHRFVMSNGIGLHCGVVAPKIKSRKEKINSWYYLHVQQLHCTYQYLEYVHVNQYFNLILEQ